MKEEQKQEASISVQSRISVATLMELDLYWISESKHIKNVSQLVSWSLDLLCEILWSNQKILRRVESIAEARNYLLERGLCQPSLYNRNFNKIGTAISFEGMREAGIDPKQVIGDGKFIENNNVVRKYNMLHNKRSIRPFSGRVDHSLVTQEMIDTMNNLNPEVIRNRALARETGKELPPIKEMGNSPEDIQERIKVNDEIAASQLDELNSLDLSQLKPVKGN